MAIFTSGAIFAWLPSIVEVLLISAIISVASTLAYKYLSDQAVMKELKAEMDRLRQKSKEAHGDLEKMKEVNDQMMPLNMKFFKLSMKPTLITLLPMLLVFWGLGKLYTDASGAAMHVVNFPFSIPLIGTWLGWVGTYIIFSIVFTTVFRKAIKVV